jgi:hypothetical protein
MEVLWVMNKRFALLIVGIVGLIAVVGAGW